MKNLGIIITLFASLLLQSCVTNTAFQTGRTVGNDNLEILGGVTFTDLAEEDSDSFDEAIGLTTRLYSTQLHGATRFGISDKFDLEGGITLGVLTLRGHAKMKYQFLGDQNSPFAGSVGFGVNVDLVTVGFEMPAYFSYHPTSNFALYTSPRYQLSFVGTGAFDAFGLVTGIKVGNKAAFYIEHGILHFGDFSNSANMNQLNAGISYKF